MTHYGGAGTSAYRLHKGLLSIGVDSSMFVMLKRGQEPGLHLLPSLSGGINQSSRDPQLRISPAWDEAVRHWRERLRAYPKRPQGLEYFSSFDAATSLESVAAIREADVVNLHWVAGMFDFGQELEFFERKAVVWTLHDMNAFTGGCHYSLGCDKYKKGCGACPQLGSNRQGDLAARQWRLRQVLYSRIDFQVVTPSTWLGKEAGDSALLGGHPVQVIPYGLPTDVFRPHPAGEVRKELGIPDDSVVLFFGANNVSNLRKGFGYLLEALARFKEHPAAKRIVLAVCGNGMDAYREALAFPCIDLGYIHDEQQMAKVYSMADAFIVPSIEDNLPNVVLESLACGTPVVGFRTGGIPDMVEHGVTGFLSEPNDAASLAAGIAWACASRIRAAEISRACRETVLARYPLHVQAQAYRSLYKGILDRRRSA